ncbi:MAG: N-acetylglucosamine-6-phosphate deacetylase [Candidatus Aminicenantes bacterium]|nr:N-acetylglucosamine-6-phosphate deacetylase [Candidatus Aminicenantes bacterium]
MHTESGDPTAQKTVIKGEVILPDRVLSKGVVEITGEKITDIYARSDRMWDGQSYFLDYSDHYISPGFIDLHIHGALGRDFMDADMESFNIIGGHLARAGVSGYLATTLSSPFPSILKVIDSVKRSPIFPLVSKPLGVHIEGPFLNVKWCGAQNANFIRGIAEEDIRSLTEATQGLKTIVTIAPEVENNMRFIHKLRENGIIVAIGHSDATYEQTLEAIRAGISHATHFFNAIPEFHHRDPGIVGAVLESEDVTVELICDGIHVHPASVRLVLDRKGPANICLITDSILAAGLGDGDYILGDLDITVKGEETRLRDGSSLAGSVLTLNKAVKNVLEWTDLSINQVVQMASLNPARVLGLDKDMGSIEKGKCANLTVYDKDFQIKQTYVYGKPVI